MISSIKPFNTQPILVNTQTDQVNSVQQLGQQEIKKAWGNVAGTLTGSSIHSLQRGDIEGFPAYLLHVMRS